jgi:predicted transcriptional regulator
MKKNYINPNSNPRYWSLEEISILRTYYHHISLDELQLKLFEVKNYYRSKRTISSKAHNLGLSKKINQNSWSQLEIDYITNHYQTMTFKEIAKNLNRSYLSVCRKFDRLGLPKKSIHDKFSSFEIEFLKENYTNSVKSLAKYLNRDINSIKYNLDKLGLLIVSKYKLYSVEEINFLKENASISCNELAKLLNRSKASVRDKMKQLEIYNPKQKSKTLEFTENEILKVKLYYPTHTLPQISKMINRNVKELSSLVRRMGLKKIYLGVLNLDDRKYIFDNVSKLSIYRIAKNLNRSYVCVFNFIKNNIQKQIKAKK